MKPIYLVAFSLVFLLTAFKGKKAGIRPSEVPGKIYFSNKPFGETSAGGKTSFTSNEYIYARLELKDGTIKDVFKIREPEKGRPYPFLVCEMEVLRNGEPVGYHKHKNNYILLQKGNLDQTWLNLDILPRPEEATTLYSMLDDFSAGNGFVPLYTMINPDYFPSAGEYRVNVRIFSKTQDLYGRDEDEEKWPFITDGFDFVLRESDIANLKKNGKAVTDIVQYNAFRYDKLPPVFSSPATISDPKATNAKIAGILKRDLPNRIILKFAVEKYSGPVWSIAKDEYGLPKYRYFNPHVWVAYKQEGRCYVGNVTLRENYSGGGTYGPLEVGFTSASDSGGDRSIDCSKIK